MQVLYDLAIDHGDPLPRRFGGRESSNLAACKVQLVGAGCEGRVGNLQLSRMDHGLAIEPHIAALLTFGAQSCLILEGVEHPVHDHLAMGAGGQKAKPKPRLHCQTVRAKAAVQLFGQIIGAHDHALQTRMGGNLGGVQHAQRRLHHGPEVSAGHSLGHRVEVSRTVHFRDQDGVNLGAARNRRVHRIGVIAAPSTIKTVDPHDPRPVAEIPISQHPRHKIARGGFFVGRDRIFQIEDDRIRRQPHSLFQRPLFRAGDVQDRAIGPCRHDSLHRNNLAEKDTDWAFSASPFLLHRRKTRSSAGTGH